MTDLQVALDALRADARRWDGAGQQLGEPLAVLPGLRLAASELSIAGAISGLDDTYEHVRTTFEDMLRAGVESCSAISGALSASADTYEHEERGNTATMDGIIR